MRGGEAVLELGGVGGWGIVEVSLRGWVDARVMHRRMRDENICHWKSMVWQASRLESGTFAWVESRQTDKGLGYQEFQKRQGSEGRNLRWGR